MWLDGAYTARNRNAYQQATQGLKSGKKCFQRAATWFRFCVAGYFIRLMSMTACDGWRAREAKRLLVLCDRRALFAFTLLAMLDLKLRLKKTTSTKVNHDRARNILGRSSKGNRKHVTASLRHSRKAREPLHDARLVCPARWVARRDHEARRGLESSRATIGSNARQSGA